MTTSEPNAKQPIQRPFLHIQSEDDFDRLMDGIDRELIDENAPIPSRPLRAALKITTKFNIQFIMLPLQGTIVPGDFSPNQINLRIHRWMERRYGDKLNVDWTTGRVVFPMRGSLYVFRCPTILGTVRFTCDPKTMGQQRSVIGTRQIPTANILDSIDGMTVDFARSLKAEEVVRLAAATYLGMRAFTALNAFRDLPLVESALGNLDAAVRHLATSSAQFGLSKWESLQAVEKALKTFISTKGGTIKKIHDLQKLFKQAAELGLPHPPQNYIDDVQCFPGVRYREADVSQESALASHLVALEICDTVVRCVALALNRPLPVPKEPLLDGLPLSEFVKKYSA